MRNRIEVRRQIDKAATWIAHRPRSWLRIVSDTRAQLGLPGLLPEGFDPTDVRFIHTTVGDVPATFPISSLTRRGDGAFNIISETREAFLGRPIILRRLKPPEEDDAVSYREEQWKQHRTQAQLRHLTRLPHHPIVPRLLTAGWIQTRELIECCVVYDFAPGENVRRFVEREGLTVGELLDLLWHGTRALEHLHRHGLVHADVKPDNFIVAFAVKDGAVREHLRVRLIDYDTISTIDEQLDEVRLGDNLAGTLPYMPPETFRQDIPDDRAAASRMAQSKDVFALGLSMLRLLNGVLPRILRGDAAVVLGAKRLGIDIGVELPETVPGALTSLIRACTQPNWRLRPTMADVVAQVRKLREDQEIRALSAEPVLEPNERPLGASGAFPALDRERDVGPYRNIIPAFQLRLDDNSYLSKLQDAHGHHYIGVPFTFTSSAEERAFTADKTALLEDMNRVRKDHPHLFPGTFRDLVRTVRPGPEGMRATIWIIRPFLEGNRDLTVFLSEIDPGATTARRLRVLRLIAESLAVLERAGYRHSGIGPRTVFFVREGDPPNVTYRQELMGMANVNRFLPGAPDRTVGDLTALSELLEVRDQLGVDNATAKAELESLGSWRRRALWLVDLEDDAECA